MSRKAFEVSFNIGGKLSNTFSQAFTSASTKVDRLKDNAKRLKTELRELDSQFKKGRIGTDQYRASQQKLASQLDRNIQQQKRYLAVQQQQAQMAAVLGEKSRAAVTATAAVLPTAVAAGATAAGAFNSVKKAMNFEAQLSSIRAVTGLADSEMEKMRALSLQVGAATKYSALEAAQGIEELLKAGISPATVMAGGLQSALDLATAGGLELAEAAEIMSDGLNGFRKDGMKAADVANILAGAANASSTGVQQIKFGLSAVGPVADGIGVSFKEVNATLAAFSNNALKGSDAGTSLKTFLSNVQPDTERANELFREFGLTLKDGSNIFFANGQLKDMAEVAEILRTKFKHLTDQQRSAMFFDLFGSDAVRAANILYKEGAQGIEKMYSEMSKVTALDVAKTKMNNAAGAVEQLAGAWETLQIVGAEATLPIIKHVAQNIAEGFEENSPKIEAWGKAMAGGLEDILAPFGTVKPDFDVNRAKVDPAYVEEYRKQMAEYQKYSKMDFGDKVTESLDEAATKMEAWVNGPGGDAMNRIFSKLAEIAIKAWSQTLTNTIQSATSQALEGNFASAAGLGVMANMMTGGLLAGGAMWAGGKVAGGAKWAGGKALGKIKKPKTKKSNKDNDNDSSGGNAKEAAGKSQPKETRESRKKKKSKSPGLFGKGLKSAKGGLKRVPFLGAGLSALDFASAKGAKGKGKAAGSAIGGLAGGALGTFLGPAGTIAGGAAGSSVGNFLGGKAVDISKKINFSGVASKLSSFKKSAGDTFRSVSEKASNFLSPLGGKVSGWMSSAKGKGLSSLSPLVGGAAGMLSQIPQKASSFLAPLGGKFSNWMSSAKAKGLSGLSPIVGGVSGLLSKLPGASVTHLGPLAGKFSGWFKTVKDSGVKGISGLPSGVSGVVSKIGGKVSGEIDVLTKKFAGYGAKMGKAISDAFASAKSAAGKVASKGKSILDSGVSAAKGGYKGFVSFVNGSHAKGISDVPFDGYRAILHKGETVLPKAEADVLRSMATGDSLLSKAQGIAPANSTNFTFQYAPNISGVDPKEIEPVLQRDRQDFEVQMNNYKHKVKRVAF